LVTFAKAIFNVILNVKNNVANNVIFNVILQIREVSAAGQGRGADKKGMADNR
jgi:hypothetical protein